MEPTSESQKQKRRGKKGSRAFVTPWGGNVDDLAVGRGRPGAILRCVNGVQIHKYIIMKVLRSQHRGCVVKWPTDERKS